MPNLNNRTALITGGANGLGAAVAKVLVAHGCNVFIADIDAHHGKALAEQLGDRAFFQSTNLTNESEVEAMMASCVTQFGKIDFAINSALALCDFTTEVNALDAATFQELLNVNVVGLGLCLKHQINHMQANQFGRIINQSSITGPIKAYKGQGLYAATKAAINALSKTAALETAADGITVNTICSAGYNTGCFERFTDGMSEEQKAAILPVNFVETADKMGELIAFLCSDNARFLTGTEIVADGGLSIT